MLYSEILKEFEPQFKAAGVENISSRYIEKRGDEFVHPDLLKFNNGELKSVILQSELESRKRTLELNEMNKAHKEFQIDLSLKKRLAERLPAKSIMPEFKDSWESHLDNIVSKAKTLGEFDLDNGQVVLKTINESSKQPKTELDKILSTLRISRFKSESSGTVEDILNQAVVESNSKVIFNL